MLEQENQKENKEDQKDTEIKKSLLDIIDKSIDYPATKRVAESVDPEELKLIINKKEK